MDNLELGKKAAMGILVDKIEADRKTFSKETGFFKDLNFDELCTNENEYVRGVPWEVGHLYEWEPDQFQLEEGRKDKEIKNVFWSSPLLAHTRYLEEGVESGDDEIRRLAYANPAFEPSEELKEDLFKSGRYDMLLSRKDWEPSGEQIKQMFDNLATDEIYHLLEKDTWSPRGEVLDKCLSHSDHDVRYLTWLRKDWTPTLEQIKSGIQDTSSEIRETAWNHPKLQINNECLEIGRKETNPKIQVIVATLESAYEKANLEAKMAARGIKINQERDRDVGFAL